MPTRFVAGTTPVVEFDPRLEISPFVLYRRLMSRTGAPLLVDVRAAPGELSFRAALPLPGPDWSPPPDLDVVLFDEAGNEAVSLARKLQEGGHARVRALFGGLELYAFALDPEVVGGDTFLERRPPG